MISFYCDVLGCSLEKRSTAVAGLVHLRAGSSLIDLMPANDEMRSDAAVTGSLDHLCIQVEPFSEDELRSHLSDFGVAAGEFERRYGADGDGISVYLRDPEGNEVELKAPPDASA
jgi:glyoxylase I family protein